VLRELQRRAARPRAALQRPLQRPALQFGRLDRQVRVADVGPDHGEMAFLVDVLEPSQRAKPSDNETFSSTASEAWIAVERSFSTMSRDNRWRRFEVA
jgi:hypothetical protein